MNNTEQMKEEFGNKVSQRIKDYRRYFNQDPKRILVSLDKARKIFDNPEVTWVFTLKIEPVKGLGHDFVLTDNNNEQKVFPDGEFSGLD